MNQASSHASSEELAAFLSRRMPAGERQAVEAHLAECAACRAELTGAHRVRAGQGRPRRRATRVVAAIALVAVVFVAVRDAPAPSTGSEQVYRGDEPGSVVRTLSPPPGGPTSRAALRFAWAGAGTEYLYRIFVLDSAGAEIWRTETSDTFAAPDARVDLAPGAEYTWYVDALGPLGDSLTSGPVPFRVR